MNGQGHGAEKRQRLSAADRRVDLVCRAAEVFSEAGFGASTREISRRCGVTQALLYKHFTSKEALVDAVLDLHFLPEGWGPDPRRLDGEEPVEQRIALFYGEFLERCAPVRLRLFIHAALNGLDLIWDRSSRVEAQMLRPVLMELCRETDTPAPRAADPLPPAMREIALNLHGGLLYFLARREVFGADHALPLTAAVALHARVHVPGAMAELRRLSSFTAH